MLKKEASRESKMCHFFGSQKKKKKMCHFLISVLVVQP